MEQTYQCGCCFEELPASSFHKNASRETGLAYYCRACIKGKRETIYKHTIRESRRMWYAKNIGYARACNQLRNFKALSEVVQEQGLKLYQPRMEIRKGERFQPRPEDFQVGFS